VNDIQTKDAIGAVAVVGGGIAGMQSALDLASNGFCGTMAQLDKTFPTNECAM
jgi:heterodisulfide reductase subunit A-like polyferredoxin